MQPSELPACKLCVLAVCQAGLSVPPCSRWQGRELWRLPQPISSKGAALAARTETTMRSGKGLKYTWILTVGCGHAKCLIPLPVISLLQLPLPMPSPCMKTRHPPLCSEIYGDSSPFHASSSAQGLRQSQQLLSALWHHLISYHDRHRCSAAASKPVHHLQHMTGLLSPPSPTQGNSF